MTDMCNTHIICFGNPLHGDDGFGHAVYCALQDKLLPENTRLLDGGTSSLNALNLFDECDYAIVVDAHQSDQEQGTLLWSEPECFASQTHQDEISSHGLGVGSILKGLEILGEDGEKTPKLDILTCSIAVPKTFKLELSKPVQASIGKAVEQILKKLAGGPNDV